MLSASQSGRGSRYIGYGGHCLCFAELDMPARNCMFDFTRLMYSTNFLEFCEDCWDVVVAVGVVVVGVVVGETVDGLAVAGAEGSVALGLAVAPSDLD